MLENMNPLLYLLGATTAGCTLLAVPTAIIEKKREKKKIEARTRKKHTSNNSGIRNNSMAAINNNQNYKAMEEQERFRRIMNTLENIEG